MAGIPSAVRLNSDIRRYYKKYGRAHLPWRKTRDPYRVLVSEVMLQQTQVERVVPFYKTFLRTFPTVRALAEATLPSVLNVWQGLGYNRRGKLLHDAAKAIIKNHGGKFPQTAEVLEGLPGVGPYTARAVLAFAFNSPEIFIETNIRTIFTHYFFAEKEGILDKEIMPFIEEALKKSRMQPRDFYAALMDYGSHLKKSGIQLNHKSAHYTKQSKFEGSRRQLRGKILKLLLQKQRSAAVLAKECERELGEVEAVLGRLMKEGVVVANKKRYAIA